jgi:hypothetical protein
MRSPCSVSVNSPALPTAFLALDSVYNSAATNTHCVVCVVSNTQYAVKGK